MIRVAAVGDLHVGPDSAGALREQLSAVPDKADVLLIAGDLTKSGEPEEAEALSRERASPFRSSPCSGTTTTTRTVRRRSPGCFARSASLSWRAMR